jgi:hypothetical protein
VIVAFGLVLRYRIRVATSGVRDPPRENAVRGLSRMRRVCSIVVDDKS